MTRFNRCRVGDVLTSLAVAGLFSGCAAVACDETAGAVAAAMLSGEDGTSIEVRIVDGESTVKVNGEEVEADQVKWDSGRIVILDEEGNERESIPLWFTGENGPGQPWNFNFKFRGEADIADVLRRFRQGSQPEPKVMLGVFLAEPGAALEEHLELEPGAATLLSAVHEGLPAHAAGLGENDIVVEVEGRSPAGPDDIREAIAEKEPGDTIEFTVIQDGRRRTVTMTLEKYDATKLSAVAPGAGMAFGGGGMVVDPQNRFFVRPPAEAPPQPGIREERRDVIADRMRIDEELEQRIEALDERLAAIERMLDELIEQARRERQDER